VAKYGHFYTDFEFGTELAWFLIPCSRAEVYLAVRIGWRNGSKPHIDWVFPKK